MKFKAGDKVKILNKGFFKEIKTDPGFFTKEWTVKNAYNRLGLYELEGCNWVAHESEVEFVFRKNWEPGDTFEIKPEYKEMLSWANEPVYTVYSYEDYCSNLTKVLWINKEKSFFLLPHQIVPVAPETESKKKVKYKATKWLYSEGGLSDKPLPYEAPIIPSKPITSIRGRFRKETSTMIPKTQKARGIMFLTEFCGTSAMGISGPSRYETHRIPGWTKDHGKLVFPLFARPCPTRPRHGFVDSRKVQSPEEILELYTKAVEGDEEGTAEVILMPIYTGKNSAIALPTNISWGYGHDGVTGSTSSVVTIPTPGSVDAWHNFWRNNCYSPQIPWDEVGIKEVAYAELVEHEGHTKIVQLRDGPVPPEGNVKNFVSQDMVVQHIIRANDYPDLLKWEAAINALKGQEGVVVFAPGAALSSHHVVHGLQNNMAVITSTDFGDIPEIGKELKKTEVVLPTLSQYDINKIHKYASRELLRSSLHEYGEHHSNGSKAATAIATIHAQSIWGNERHLLQLRGISMIRLVRFALAACMGELRHMQRGRITPMDDPLFDGNSRSSIYSHYLIYGTIEDAHRLFPTIIEDFERQYTDEPVQAYVKSSEDDEDCDCEDCKPSSKLGKHCWRDGFGGKAWGRVSKAAYELVKRLETFMVNPNLDTWQASVLAANMFIHQSHNGGKVLTKWVDPSFMDNVANLPVLGFMNQEAVKTLLKNRGDY